MYSKKIFKEIIQENLRSTQEKICIVSKLRKQAVYLTERIL